MSQDYLKWRGLSFRERNSFVREEVCMLRWESSEWQKTVFLVRNKLSITFFSFLEPSGTGCSSNHVLFLMFIHIVEGSTLSLKEEYFLCFVIFWVYDLL